MLWIAVLVASAFAFATKMLGFLLPHRILEKPMFVRVTHVLTVGLLAALVAVNTFSSGEQVVLDARAGALGVAGLALLARLPFILVVILGAGTAALLRFLGVAA